MGCLSDTGLDSGDDYIAFPQSIDRLISDTSISGKFHSLDRV